MIRMTKPRYTDLTAANLRRSRIAEQKRADWLEARGWSCFTPEQAPRVHSAILSAHAVDLTPSEIAEEWNRQVQAEMELLRNTPENGEGS